MLSIKTHEIYRKPCTSFTCMFASSFQRTLTILPFHTHSLPAGSKRRDRLPVAALEARPQRAGCDVRQGRERCLGQVPSRATALELPKRTSLIRHLQISGNHSSWYLGWKTLMDNAFLRSQDWLSLTNTDTQGIRGYSWLWGEFCLKI